MRWKGREISTNVEDRRGSDARKGIMGGGIGTVIAIAAYFLSGGDILQIINGIPLTREYNCII